MCFTRVCLVVLMTVLPGDRAHAIEVSGIELSGSGFLSIVAGKVLSGTHDATVDQGFNCPCFISDYAHGGIYESGGVKFGPDSKLGLQGTAAAPAGKYSVTAQVVARGAQSSVLNLEWLYATMELGSAWTLQAGRKRLPLFISSEVQDVGYALPWVHLAPQLYGWEVVNYNGASLTYRGQVADWLATAQVLAGNESRRDSGYWQVYNGKDTRTDVRWSDIVGGEMKLSRGGFDARVVFIESNTQNRAVSAGESDFSEEKRQRIHGLSLSADDGQWLARAEFLYINRRQDYGFDHAQLYAAGYQFGAWLPMLSYSNYQQTLNDGPDGEEGHSTRTLSLRYDLGRSSALKAQYDHWRDHSGAAFASMHGDAHVLTISYDRVF